MSQSFAKPGKPSTRAEESGAVLVLFALLMFGVFGMLGLVIDGGRLRVSKQQMDAGAEIAALEGVRFKDQEGDVGRRTRAIRATAMLWDDDLDTSNGDAIGLGAGTLPIVTPDTPFSGEILASTVAAERVWKPATELQQNLPNAAHGDLVAGNHIALADSTEDDAFQRSDFAPSPAGSSADELTAAPAFLVRLRRATDRLDLDRQDGISSAGPAFEWLWARGSAWQEPGATDGNQSRATGLTVRATAIAATERALAVSDDPTNATTVATIALRGDAGSLWNATGIGATLTLELGSDGLLTVAGAEQGIALQQRARAVGNPLAVSAGPPVAISTAELIVPIYGDVNGQRIVAGFTRAVASLAGSTLVITRRPAAVLPGGATSVSPAALDARIALEITPALRTLHASFSEPVLAPVLRR